MDGGGFVGFVDVAREEFGTLGNGIDPVRDRVTTFRAVGGDCVNRLGRINCLEGADLRFLDPVGFLDGFGRDLGFNTTVGDVGTDICTGSGALDGALVGEAAGFFLLRSTSRISNNRVTSCCF